MERRSGISLCTLASIPQVAMSVVGEPHQPRHSHRCAWDQRQALKSPEHRCLTLQALVAVDVHCLYSVAFSRGHSCTGLAQATMHPRTLPGQSQSGGQGWQEPLSPCGLCRTLRGPPSLASGPHQVNRNIKQEVNLCLVFRSKTSWPLICKCN